MIKDACCCFCCLPFKMFTIRVFGERVEEVSKRYKVGERKMRSGSPGEEKGSEQRAKPKGGNAASLERPRVAAAAEAGFFFF